MELKKEELLIIEESFNAKIAFHESEIEEIKRLPDSYYEKKLERGSIRIVNQFKDSPDTIETLREKDIQKEIYSIKIIEDLKKKLFLSDSCLLLVSNKIQLKLS